MENLILKLRKNKIGIHLDQGALRLDIPKHLDATEILEEIKKNKNELIKFIENTQSFNSTYKVIEKAPEKEYYTLSSAQKRMYFLYEYNKTSLNYNTPQLVCLNGELDIDLLKEVFNTLVMRHESLRTIFKIVNEEPVQKIVSNLEIDIEVFKITESEESQVIQNFVRPFDLNNGPLIRVGVIHLTERKHILMVDMHHIITDGVSDSILVKEFMALYKGETLSPLSLQYRDYAEWQQKNNQQLEISEQKNFWLDMFKEETQPINLPTDFKRPQVKGHNGATASFSIENEQARKLKSINEDLGSTGFMMFLSVYYILLYKLTNQEDIVIGTPVAGREHEDLNDMIGMFVNTLPLRNQLKGNDTFRAFLLDIKANTLACIRNQSYQYEALIDELKVERDTSRNPLFDILFSYQNFIEEELDIPGLKLSAYQKEDMISKFDMSLTTTEKKDQFTFKISYSVDLFTEQTIHRFITYYKRIVTAVIENPDTKLSEIDILSDKEKSQLLEGFNATDVEFTKCNSVLELFESQVSKTPDALAIVNKDTTLTYQELNDQVDQMSAYLLTKKDVELEE
ncbi:condensation domain-containing protein, partial [Aquimarina sp. 2304DJ70-9]|uniref:condensation domain-containing protein n=1 Tax=Aquimarina penaris TaxID=3231044 RepID=UPI003463356F